MKIKARKKTNDIIYEMKRRNEIQSVLNSCFEKKSIDEKDEAILLDWACGFINKEKLIYLLEKKKFEILKK